jgi:autotransporter passenger strand-loop-strand repeat protein
MASYSWNGGSGGWGTIGNWTGGIPNSTGADVTIDASGGYVVTLEAGHSYSVDSVTLNDGGATLDLLGTLTLGGALALLQVDVGVLEIGGLISGGTVDITASSTLAAAGGSLAKLADFDLGGSATIDLDNDALTIGGSSTLQGYINGGGDLTLSGHATLTDGVWIYDGATLVDTGTIDQQSVVQFGQDDTSGAITIAAGATYDMQAQNSALADDGVTYIYNAGLFKEDFAASASNPSYEEIENFTNASTGTLDAVSANSTFYLFGNDLLAGTVDGAGEIDVYSGTVTLESGVHFTAGTLGVGGSQTLVLGASQSLSTEFDEADSGYLDLNGDNLTVSGTGTVRGYVFGGGTLDITGSFVVGGLYIASGTEELITGTALDESQSNRLDYDNNTPASILSIATHGTYDITNTNSYIDYNGTRGTIINSGLFESTGTYNGSYFNEEENFTNSSTGTITAIAGEDISLIYGQDSLAGTIDGAGGIFMGNGATITLAAGLVLDPTGLLTFSDGGSAIILGGSRTIGNNFILQNSANLELKGYNATFDGSGSLGAYITGPGTFYVSGTYNVGGLSTGNGVTEILSGTEYQNNNVGQDYDLGGSPNILSITSTGTYNITSDTQFYNGNNNQTGTGTISNGGLFEKTGLSSYTNVYSDLINDSTATVSIISYNDISLLGAENLLAGKITGGGELYIGAGSTELEAGLALTVGDFDIYDSGVTLGGNLSFASQFILQNSGVLDLNSNTFTATGTTGLYAYLEGSGELDVTKKADISGLELIDKAVLLDTGTITQDGNFQMGGSNSDTTHLTIATGAVFDFLNNNGIAVDGTAAITNDGLLEKNGDNGGTNINVRVNNATTGTIDAVDGAIILNAGGSLSGTLAGPGNIQLNGGVFTLAPGLVVDVATLYVDGGTAELVNNHSFSTDFQELAGDINLEGFTLTASNAALESSSLTGPGTLNASGALFLYNYTVTDGAALEISGTAVAQGNVLLGTGTGDAASLIIAAGGIYVAEDDGQIYSNGGRISITNAGTFEKAADNGISYLNVPLDQSATGVLDALVGTIAINGGGTIGGTLTGGGEIDLDNSGDVLRASVVNVAALGIYSDPTLATNLTYGGDFYLAGSESFSLTSHALVLSGTASLNGAFEGPGTVTVTGTADVNLLDLIGGATLVDSKYIDQINTLRFAYYYDGSSDSLTVSSGAIYQIQDDTGFAAYPTGSGTETVLNAGLFEKTGETGISEIQPIFTNTGTVLATLGTLQFDSSTNFAGGTLTGGTWEAEGGNLLLEGTTALTTDAADIILSGAASEIYSGSASVPIITSLNSIAATGTLQILNQAAISTPIADAGKLIVTGAVVGNVTVVAGGAEYVGANGNAGGTILDAGSQYVSSGGKVTATVVSSGGKEFVSSGGVASGTKVDSLGSATVYSGGVASGATIAGGTLEFASGGVASGTIDFTGSGGLLILESPTMPTNVISGFVAGDTIQLAGVTYVSGATVTVASAGVVSIKDGSNTYNLNIAGATVGETDFQFSSSSLLTKGAAAAKPKFLPSLASSSAAKTGLEDNALRALYTVPRATPKAAAAHNAATTTATAHGLYAGHDLLTVARGGTETLLAAHPPW